jgi:hypothetical protein
MASDQAMWDLSCPACGARGLLEWVDCDALYLLRHGIDAAVAFPSGFARSSGPGRLTERLWNVVCVACRVAPNAEQLSGAEIVAIERRRRAEQEKRIAEIVGQQVFSGR